MAKKRGEKVGCTVIEPKGDLARMVRDMAIEMGLEDELVYVDPLYPEETHQINVMVGEKNDVTEATVAVLNSLFGKQEAFFATVQELSSRKVTQLLKELYGDNMDILDVLANLRDEQLLKKNVEKYRAQFGNTDIVHFFDNELLGSGQTAENYRKLIVGLRSQLENITSNEYLKSIVTGKSDINLDEHLEKGGILAVNTALGKLGKSGDAFGMFIAMHMQLATFRRSGTERTRIPHYLLIDEYSRYINPDVERFLSVSPEYRVALVAAIQSLSQLEIESGKLNSRAMKNAILTNTQNKIFFGGLEYTDAEEASKIMGTDIIVERNRSYDGGILKNILPKTYKDQEVEKARFHPSIFMDGLPRFHCICKLRKNGVPLKPIVAKGEFVPNDWKEQVMAEEHKKIARKKPPFWKIKQRAFYNVEKYEYMNAERLKEERRNKLVESNPFADHTTNEPSPQSNQAEIKFTFNLTQNLDEDNSIKNRGEETRKQVEINEQLSDSYENKTNTSIEHQSPLNISGIATEAKWEDTSMEKDINVRLNENISNQTVDANEPVETLNEQRKKQNSFWPI